jgi:HK97 family phage prohead protease
MTVEQIEVRTAVEYRTAAALEVRHAQRVIELIAVPYDEPTEVLRRGRMVTETVASGAFAGVHGDVTVNRAHDLERPLGRVLSLHPQDPRGLRAELRMSRTAAGDEALELAADELLSASVGFQVLPGGEEWTHDRRAVKVTRAKLVHIALTGDPAYSGARVLAVRSAAPIPERVPTPNLDRIRLEMAAARGGMDLGGT